MNTGFGNVAMTSSARKAIDDLLAVTAALRTPGSGCPWDLEQTFKTIAPYTIEEAYEVADAIEKGDMGALEDELGDLLLQVVYHARMAEEDGAFAFADVVDVITRKMIRRHPHVFGSQAERAAGAAPGLWERIKAEERSAKHRQPDSPPPHAGGVSSTSHAGGVSSTSHAGGVSSTSHAGGVSSTRRGEGLEVGGATEGRVGILDGVPPAFPALTRAVKLQDKAAKVGFDWPSLAPVFDKLKEELAELEQAVAAGDRAP